MMADLRFQGKGSKQGDQVFTKGLAGSLALRVFSSTVIFLVLPLLVFSFFMYRYTFELKRSGEETRLNLVSDNQTLVFEELVSFALQRLEILSIYLDAAQDPQDIVKINPSLSQIVDFTGVSGVFVAEQKGAKAQIKYSSEGFTPDMPLSSFLNLELFTISDFAIITDQEAVGKKGFIYFSKLLKTSDESGTKTLNIAISNKFFIEYLTRITGYQGVYSISLFREKDGVIFDTQELSFLGKKIVRIHSKKFNKMQGNLELKSISADENTFIFKEYDIDGYATILPLAQVNFGVLITTSTFQDYHNLEQFFYTTMLFLAGVVILGTLGSLGVMYLFSLPLKNISHVMEDLSNHKLDARYEPKFYGFEINKLGLMLNSMIDRLISNLKALENQTVKREKFQKELEIGHQIQSSLIPRQFPLIKDIEIKTALIPAKEVGGDFYDCFINPSSKDELILLIADSAGHGVFGCFYSLIMRSILRTLGSEAKDLKTILKQANRLFYQDSQETQVFVTVWMGIYNMKTRRLTYSSCGHPLGFLFREKALNKELATAGIALGAIEEIEPTIACVEIKQGDTLVFLTDGVTETKNNQGQLFGKQRCIDTIALNLNKPLQEVFDHLLAQVEIFEENPDNQDDDFTAMMLRIL
jgi:serine phosphatase RsbU (regulator of sigma subunit)